MASYWPDAALGLLHTPQCYYAPVLVPAFLKLPAELRNRIYQLVLIDPNEVNITASNMAPPPLLEVNRQIREEATPVYYLNNQFVIAIDDYDALAVLPFIDCWTRYCGYCAASADEAPQVEIQFTGDPNWKNLYQWIRAEWDRGMTGIVYDSAVFWQHGRLMNGFFKVKRSLMLRGYSWEALEAALAGLREMLSADDGRWALGDNDESDESDEE